MPSMDFISEEQHSQKQAQGKTSILSIIILVIFFVSIFASGYTALEYYSRRQLKKEVDTKQGLLNDVAYRKAKAYKAIAPELKKVKANTVPIGTIINNMIGLTSQGIICADLKYQGSASSSVTAVKQIDTNCMFATLLGVEKQIKAYQDGLITKGSDVFSVKFNYQPVGGKLISGTDKPQGAQINIYIK